MKQESLFEPMAQIIKKSFITTHQAELITAPVQSSPCKCDCGESYKLIFTDGTELIVCNECFKIK